MSNILYIELKATDDELALFPYLDDQFPVHEGYGDHEETFYFVEIDLGDRKDTTAAQEQYLNTQPSVVSYRVRDADSL